MKRTVLIAGSIAGAILAVMIIAMIPGSRSGSIDFERSELIGYTTMVLAFLAIFFGIRADRENAGGSITFGRAFKVGILITLVASAIYVVTWEIVYFNFIPEFLDQYVQHAIGKMQQDGASISAIAAEKEKMARLSELYQNPLFNAGITFMEVFPVGLIVSLISAAILRKTTPNASSTAAAAA